MEALASDKLMKALMQPLDHRFVQPTPETLRNVSPHLACHIIAQHLLDMANVEISVIGDFINSEEDAKEFEALLLNYMGTIAPQPSLLPSLPPAVEDGQQQPQQPQHPLHDTEKFKELSASRTPILSLTSEGPMKLSFADKPRANWFHMKDDVEACFACLGFPTLNRWGQRGSSATSPPVSHASERDSLLRRGHVLFKSRAMNLLTEALYQIGRAHV